MSIVVNDRVAISRQRRASLLFAALTLVGCQHPTATATAIAPPAEAPAAPRPTNTMTEWRPSSQETFSVKDHCLSAPIERSFIASDAPFGRKLVVEIDSPRALSLGFQVLVDGRELITSTIDTYVARSRSTDVPSLDHCEGGPGAVVAVGSSNPAGPATPSPKAKGRESTAPAAALASAPLVMLSTPMPDPFDARPNTIHVATETRLFLPTIKPRQASCYSVKGRLGETLAYSFGEIKAGAKVTVRLYRTTGTRDVQDAVFRVSLMDVAPKLPAADYEAYLAAHLEEDIAGLEADAAACMARSKAYYENPPASPAPLPPTPKRESPGAAPQRGAVWIAGSWRWTGTEYLWEVGFWRLPDEVAVVAQAAPSAPPAEKVETPPAPTMSNVVWVPGYWVWIGDGYVWVSGQWELPPQIEMRWVPPRWEVRLGVHTFLPGKWVAPRK